MSHIVAIAGGSGGLGRTLVDALKNSTYKPLVLARQATSKLENDLGVTVLHANYLDQDSLVELLERHKIDTVISTITNYDNSHSAEINLVEAAERSSVTHRYIPSVWSGFEYRSEQGNENPIAASRLALLEAMSRTDLEWTAIFPGIFLDFYTLTIPSYTKRTTLSLDIDGNAAAIPGDGTYPMYFTHTTDIAKYTAALLGLTRWEKKYYLYGDKLTWNEAIAIAEAAKGVKFNVAYDSIEKLKKGKMTELPGEKLVYEQFMVNKEAREAFRKTIAGIAVYMAEGRMVYGGPMLNEIFSSIKPLTFREALGQGNTAD